MAQPRPLLLDSIAKLRDWRASVSGTVGFVPTMGALHEGHAQLLREARKKNDQVVLSIYVNPTQFGEGEDLEQYPRTLEQDLEVASREGVDIVFTPSNEMMYPPGFSSTVIENKWTQPLCGRYREGHFSGVTTVVLKLFHLVQPHDAFFGLKDVQQYFVLRKMVEDLNVPVRMHGVETVRESDGLALSSRNAYLSEDQRKKAPLLFEILKKAKEQILSGEDVLDVTENSRQELNESGFQVQYLECLDVETFESPGSHTQQFLIAVAAFLGETRLIDNIVFYRSACSASLSHTDCSDSSPTSDLSKHV